MGCAYRLRSVRSQIEGLPYYLVTLSINRVTNNLQIKYINWINKIQYTNVNKINHININKI